MLGVCRGPGGGAGLKYRLKGRSTGGYGRGVGLLGGVPWPRRWICYRLRPCDWHMRSTCRETVPELMTWFTEAYTCTLRSLVLDDSTSLAPPTILLTPQVALSSAKPRPTGTTL